MRLLEAQYDEDGEDDPAVDRAAGGLDERIDEIAGQGARWARQMARAAHRTRLACPATRAGGAIAAYSATDAEAESEGGSRNGRRVHPLHPRCRATLVEALTARRTAALRQRRAAATWRSRVG